MKPKKPLRFDTYGFLVTKPRNRKCRCPEPCQRTFRCRSRRHIGNRATPYCCGGDGESCAVCWVKQEAERSRRAA